MFRPTFGLMLEILNYFMFELCLLSLMEQWSMCLSRNTQKKQNTFYLGTFNDAFFLLFEQGVPHVHFKPCPENDMVSPD